MTVLSIKQIYLPPPPPVQQVAQPLQFVKPLSYEFRVVETLEDNKITKVALQVQVWEHDEHGSGSIKTYWHDVPRFKFDASGTPIPQTP